MHYFLQWRMQSHVVLSRRRNGETVAAGAMLIKLYFVIDSESFGWQLHLHAHVEPSSVAAGRRFWSTRVKFCDNIIYRRQYDIYPRSQTRRHCRVAAWLPRVKPSKVIDGGVLEWWSSTMCFIYKDIGGECLAMRHLYMVCLLVNIYSFSKIVKKILF